MNRNKKKIIIGIGIIALIVVFVGINLAKSSKSATAFGGGKTFNVSVAKVEKGSIASAVSANGVIEEAEPCEIYFDSPMKVKQVLVGRNQQVSVGQKLLELDMDALNSELEQLKTNKAIQELAMQKFKKSRGKASISDNNMKTAENAYLEYKKLYEDSLDLFLANAISKSELDKAKKNADDAKITYDNALMTMDIDLRTQMLNLKTTEITIQDLEKKIEKINSTVLSPVNGIIGEIHLNAGAYTVAAQSAMRIVRNEDLIAKAKVSEYNIKTVAVGQSVKITGDAIDKGDQVTGKILSISPSAVLNMTSSGQETVVEVLIGINKHEKPLRPGLNVTCDISTNEKKNVVVTGMEVFEEDKDSNKFVYVIDEKKNIMQRKPVTLGITSDMQAEILSGLNEGDLVILYPQPTFKDGAKIKIQEEEKK